MRHASPQLCIIYFSGRQIDRFHRAAFSEDTRDTGDTGDTRDTGDTGDTRDTRDTGDTGDKHYKVNAQWTLALASPFQQFEDDVAVAEGCSLVQRRNTEIVGQHRIGT